jgi:hypothetical protein
MSSNENQQNQNPQETPKEGQPKEAEKKAEGSGSKAEYKGNNPGGSEWKNNKKA